VSTAQTKSSSVDAVFARCGAKRAIAGSSLTCHSACGPSPRYGGAGARITIPLENKRPQKTKDLGAFASGSLDPGPDLFSRGPTSRVSSALVGLTTVFGMGTGMTPPLQGPRRQFYRVTAARQRDGVPAVARATSTQGARQAGASNGAPK